MLYAALIAKTVTFFLFFFFDGQRCQVSKADLGFDLKCSIKSLVVVKARDE